ncbi:MAG: hypothetical protein QG660_1512 [Pseudomonadota bacterium]|nr:hypothetical protein [Pseudomonadota bacterium]MDQ5945793.1 hypothetical protein [Pseudomonadota bacterium]
MSQQVSDNIANDPRFLKFVAKRNAYGAIMTILGAVAYYGFILAVAFNPAFMATKMGPGWTMSIGVPIGVGVIVFTIILTWVYVRRANGEFDTEAAEILHLANK